MKMPHPVRLIFVFLLAVPALLLGLFLLPQFPFTSEVIAHAVAPSGEEVCVVQTFKGVEPYQVSLFARRSGQKWAWSYLAHQDNRWRSCRLEFIGDALQVYRGSELNRSFSLKRATDITDDLSPLPAEYTPEMILAHHNQLYQR